MVNVQVFRSSMLAVSVLVMGLFSGVVTAQPYAYVAAPAPLVQACHCHHQVVTACVHSHAPMAYAPIAPVMWAAYAYNPVIEPYVYSTIQPASSELVGVLVRPTVWSGQRPWW